MSELLFTVDDLRTAFIGGEGGAPWNLRKKLIIEEHLKQSKKSIDDLQKYINRLEKERDDE